MARIQDKLRCFPAATKLSARPSPDYPKLLDIYLNDSEYWGQCQIGDWPRFKEVIKRVYAVEGAPCPLTS